MSSLTQDEKELVFDYCLGACPEAKVENAEQLIRSNAAAAELHSQINETLSPLDAWQVESCPDSLVESTLERLSAAAEAGHVQLEQLLAGEEARGPSRGQVLWLNIARRLAMAAVFMIVGTIIFKAAGLLGYRRDRIQCQDQMAGMWRGIQNYSDDHDGRMPAVATSSGSPWWKVGYQGSENCSNTRHVWLLPKLGYVEAKDFMCPGKKHDGLKPISRDQAQYLKDFPQRRYIVYSFRVAYEGLQRTSKLGSRVIISDLNPLFESLPDDFNQTLLVRLNEGLRKLNSSNHKGRGQNVLFGSGNVRFVKTRTVEISNDDIFTLRDRTQYEGFEIPVCDMDSFLAP